MVSVILYPCIFCVSLLMDMFVLSCVSDSVCELFGETICIIFGCACYFVEWYRSVGGCSLLDRPSMVFQRMCVLCM